MFSQTTEYALRAAATLARDPEVPKTAQQISQATQVPAFYMSKILHDLGGAGLVHAQRGRHGGFILAHPPEQVSILDVVNAIAPLHRITRCPLGIPGHVRLCPLHRRIDDAIAHVEESFGRTSLAVAFVKGINPDIDRFDGASITALTRTK